MASRWKREIGGAWEQVGSTDISGKYVGHDQTRRVEYRYKQNPSIRLTLDVSKDDGASRTSVQYMNMTRRSPNQDIYQSDREIVTPRYMSDETIERVLLGATGFARRDNALYNDNGSAKPISEIKAGTKTFNASAGGAGGNKISLSDSNV